MKCEKESQIDRRMYRRFKVRDDAYAMVTPLSQKRGEIVDISRGGLALQYVSSDEQPAIVAEIDPYLHIFLRDISFCLLRIPIKTVSDFEVGLDEGACTVRRRSVVFGSMSESQRSELDHFIERHTLH